METEQKVQNRASLVTFLLLLTLFGYILWSMVAPYALSLFAGGILATLVYPVYQRLCPRLGPRVSSALITVGIILLVVLPFLVCGTLAVRQGIAVGEWATAQAKDFSLHDFFDRVSGWLPGGSLSNPAKLQADASELLQQAGHHVTTIVLEVAKRLPETLLNLFLACLACFFMLTDGRRFVAWVATKVPMDPDVRQKLVATFKDTSIGVVWASMVAAGVQAVAAFAVFLIMGVPASALALVATFIFAWVPIVGSMPIWLCGLIYLGVTGSMTKVIVMLVLAGVAGLADHLVRPLVLRGRGEMHPLVSLVAIFGGIAMFGLLGVFFGPILAAVVITLLQVWPDVGRRNGLRFSE